MTKKITIVGVIISILLYAIASYILDNLLIGGSYLDLINETLIKTSILVLMIQIASNYSEKKFEKEMMRILTKEHQQLLQELKKEKRK